MIRKTVIAIIAAAAILPFVSCNKEGREAPAEADGENLVTITIPASTHAPESEVKAALQSDGKVFWEDGDKIAVYDGYALREFTLTSGAGSSSGSFRGEIAAAATSIEAVYPYAAAYLENKVLKYSLPDQVIPSGKLADPAALVSKAEPVAPGSSLFFRNKATLFKFNAPAAGNVYFVSSCGDGNFGAPDRRTLTVNCPSAGTFYAAVVPGDYNGFNAFSNGKIKKATKPFSLPANGIVNLGDVTGTEDVTLIWNASELSAFLASPSKPGYVMASIDASYGITGADTFSGTLDGQGNEIHKWMASGEALVGNSSAPLTGCVNNGNISVSVSSVSVNCAYWGGVTRRIGNSTLKGCANNGNFALKYTVTSSKTHEWIHSDYKTKDGTAIHEHVLSMAGGTYWHYYNCPDGSPYSYTVFKIDGNEIVDYYLKAIGKPKDFQMRVYDGSAAITAPGSHNKYYWYNATNTMTNSSGKSYNAQGNSALKGCFVANIWCANDDWTLELWQNGTKKGTLSRKPEICDVFNAAWIFEDGDANYDEVSRGAQHYYYIKDASSSPGTATNWYIKATHKIPGAHGATHTYTCSSITSSYSPFLWE